MSTSVVYQTSGAEGASSCGAIGVVGGGRQLVADEHGHPHRADPVVTAHSPEQGSPRCSSQ